MPLRAISTPRVRHKKPTGYATLDKAHPLSQGLVAYYLMNETGASVCKDFTGNENHAVFTGSPTWGSLGGNLAVLFNGSSSYLLIADSATLAWDTMSAFTIVTKVSPVTDTDSATIFSQWGASTPTRPIMIEISDTGTGYRGTINAYSDFIESSTTSAADNTRNLAFTWNSSGSGSIRLYVEGVEEVSDLSTETSLDSNSSNGVAIGARIYSTVDQFWDGYIEYMGIYNRELTPQEIYSLSVDPYQIIKTQTINSFYTVSAAGTLPSGSLSLLGAGI